MSSAEHPPATLKIGILFLNVPDTEASLEKRSEAVPHEVGQLFSKEDAVLGRRLGHKIPGEPTFLAF